ncbi:MAG: secondary thiamine-phosphate synthase enzyme YjbQ [Gammaproteobacteria bacterium]|nr:secondary thiamine-phosphate synthase enzyme YjbQ [Gammaproteobacteria bacterium]MCK5262539.1 secondary thiamine-phosphate synthase enzyme YjbQ [Gammaproteobacteria bacterium]
MLYQNTLQLAEHSQGAYEITELIEKIIKTSKIHTGTCHLFIHNSSSAILISDTADDSTKDMTADFMAQLAPSSIDSNENINSAMDAVPPAMKHARSQNELTIPITNGKPGIGVWQGIFLWEYKSAPIERKLTVTIMGEARHRSFRLSH